jgi:hypothetical protein
LLAQETPYPHVGSFAYRRGTAARVRILRRDLAGPDGPACLVTRYERHPRTFTWTPMPGASANTTVPEAELFETPEQAMFCGRPPAHERGSRRGGKSGARKPRATQRRALA